MSMYEYNKMENSEQFLERSKYIIENFKQYIPISPTEFYHTNKDVFLEVQQFFQTIVNDIKSEWDDDEDYSEDVISFHNNTLPHFEKMIEYLNLVIMGKWNNNLNYKLVYVNSLTALSKIVNLIVESEKQFAEGLARIDDSLSQLSAIISNN